MLTNAYLFQNVPFEVFQSLFTVVSIQNETVKLFAASILPISPDLIKDCFNLMMFPAKFKMPTPLPTLLS